MVLTNSIYWSIIEDLGETVRVKIAGRTTLLNKQDLHLLEKYRFSWSKFGYLRYFCGRSRRSIALHRLICDYPDAEVIDHIDRDPANNTRENLRPLTLSMNSRNSMRLPESGVRGVMRQDDRWRVRIVVHGRARHFGSFSTIEEAAEVADKIYAELFSGVSEEELVRTYIGDNYLPSVYEATPKPDIHAPFVVYDYRVNKFRVRAKLGGKKPYLGVFKDLAEAEALGWDVFYNRDLWEQRVREGLV